jgi:hypothetical protein
MAYLPQGWRTKQAFVRQQGGSSIDNAKLVRETEGGIELEFVEDQATRRIFVPWTAVLEIELLGDPGKEPRGATRIVK